MLVIVLVLDWLDYDYDYEHEHEWEKAEFAYFEVQRSMFAAYLG